MTPDSPLLRVSLATLRHLHRGVAAGTIAAPLVDLELRRRGLEVEVVAILVESLGELSRGPLLAVLGALLGERERAERERPRLLWTGPSARRSGALDTRIQLLECFAEAQSSVFCAGYAFNDRSLLRPLHAAMIARDLGVEVVLNIGWNWNEVDGRDREARIVAAVADFFRDVWPAEGPRPRLYVDPRTAARNQLPGDPPGGGYFAAMHAKAVVIDASVAIVGSANFTAAGTRRNIEAGVLLRSEGFAHALLQQWRGLIADGILREVG